MLDVHDLAEYTRRQLKKSAVKLKKAVDKAKDI